MLYFGGFPEVKFGGQRVPGAFSVGSGMKVHVQSPFGFIVVLCA